MRGWAVRSWMGILGSWTLVACRPTPQATTREPAAEPDSPALFCLRSPDGQRLSGVTLDLSPAFSAERVALPLDETGCASFQVPTAGFWVVAASARDGSFLGTRVYLEPGTHIEGTTESVGDDTEMPIGTIEYEWPESRAALLGRLSTASPKNRDRRAAELALAYPEGSEVRLAGILSALAGPEYDEEWKRRAAAELVSTLPTDTKLLQHAAADVQHAAELVGTTEALDRVERLFAAQDDPVVQKQIKMHLAMDALARGDPLNDRKGPQAGDRLPPLELVTPEGGEPTLGRLTILYFWASWCHPCIESPKKVHALAERFSELDLHVISVSIDENPDAASRFETEHGPFPGQRTLPAHDYAAEHLGVTTVPTYLLVVDGTIAVRVGNGGFGKLEAWLSAADPSR